MIAVHLDPRITARVDPSGMVQEALIDASRRLPDYLAKRPIEFYPWLREIARRKLIDVLRRHLGNQTRTVLRETELVLHMPDDSVVQRADQLIDSGTSPSRLVSRQEQQVRGRATLKQLSPEDRNLLLMRFLEQLKVCEMAEVLEPTERALKYRLARAIERLHTLLGAQT